VRSQLNLPHAIFHFTGHGAYNALRPQDSALGLTDGELTAKEIAQLDLSSYQLISLAACETALTGAASIQAEYVGLASAALKAGAANVLSTLWQVDEIASCWFMIHFYQELLTHADLAKSCNLATTCELDFGSQQTSRT
jgi:CHAT domain-containing protein